MEILNYKAPNGIDSKCGIRYFEDGEHELLIVVTELPNNPGMSITNAIECVAQRIKDAIVAKFSLIEHYNNDGIDRYDLVQFEKDFVTPSWIPMTKEEIKVKFGYRV